MDCDFAATLEVVAAGLSQLHAFKPPVKLRQIGHKGGRPVGDCVEVGVRSVRAQCACIRVRICACRCWCCWFCFLLLVLLLVVLLVYVVIT